jgi:hypothetical protein
MVMKFLTWLEKPSLAGKDCALERPLAWRILLGIATLVWRRVDSNAVPNDIAVQRETAYQTADERSS